MTVFWTPARENHLAALVRKGLPASKIGEALGCSRNAVVGKVMRGQGRFGKLDGWAGRRHRADVPARKSEPAVRRRLVTKPAPGAAPVPAPAPARQPAPPPAPIPFLQAIDEGRCLWFAGEAFGPNGPDMPVCGDERAGAGRYCARHAAMVGRREPA